MRPVALCVLLAGCVYRVQSGSAPSNGCVTGDAAVSDMAEDAGLFLDGSSTDAQGASDGATDGGCCSCTVMPALPSVSMAGNVILPLGDSLTFGIGDPNTNSYRLELYNRFVADGLSPQFVGSLIAGNGLPSAQQFNEGHAGYEILDISVGVPGVAGGLGVDAWIAAHPNLNRIVLMIGTNDVIRSVDLQHVGAREAALLDQIHADCPSCIVFNANAPPVQNTGYLMQFLNTYNAEVRSNCLLRPSFCRFIDVNSAPSWPGDFASDGIHMLPSGYLKVGDAIYNAMKAAD